MKNLDLDTLARITDGKIFSEKEISFSRIGTDTRKDLKGQIFIALKGDAFDAHDFCAKAVEQGASGLLIHRLPPELEKLRSQVTVLVVKDTLKALQQIAHFQRHQSPAKVIAITGSNGKTTSKEFSAAVLSSQLKVHYSKGSFNNHWGLPFSILDEPEGTQVSILEMGMNHAGEIRALCEIADPDIVVCSVVGRAHIEHFGTVDGIAAAKKEIYDASPATAQRIYNLDSPWTLKMYSEGKAKFPQSQIWTFSANSDKADIHLKIKSMGIAHLEVEGVIRGVSGQAHIPVFGAQNLTNLMVAASVGIASGLTPAQVWAALPQCKTIWGRNQMIETKSKAQILFDGYNANPDSVGALLDNVAILKAGKKIAVFGEMLELGTEAAGAHSEIGEKAGRAGFDVIWFYGPHAQDFSNGVKASGFSKKLIISNAYEESLATEVASMLSQGDLAIVKGSRGMELEKFVLRCDPVNFSTTKF